MSAAIQQGLKTKLGRFHLLLLKPTSEPSKTSMWTPEKYFMQVTLGLSEGGWKGHFKVWQFLPGKCHVSSRAGCHLTFNRSGSSGSFGSNCLMRLGKCWQEPCSLVTAWPRSQGVAGGARKDAGSVNHPRPATCRAGEPTHSSNCLRGPTPPAPPPGQEGLPLARRQPRRRDVSGRLRCGSRAPPIRPGAPGR